MSAGRYRSLFVGMGREALEAYAAQVSEHLTHVQERCTAQQLELRALKAAQLLPGWVCPVCEGFNGDARKPQSECRACGQPRPAG